MKKIFEKIILDQCYSPNFCFFIYICFLWENRLELRAQIHRVTCYTNYLCSAWISLKSVNLDRFYKRFFTKISEMGGWPLISLMVIYIYISPGASLGGPLRKFMKFIKKAHFIWQGFLEFSSYYSKILSNSIFYFVHVHIT